MVALQILVLSVWVRILVGQHNEKRQKNVAFFCVRKSSVNTLYITRARKILNPDTDKLFSLVQ